MGNFFQAISKLLIQLRVDKVTVAVSTDPTSQALFVQFQDFAQISDICLATIYNIDDSSNDTKLLDRHASRRFVEKLEEEKEQKVVVLFLNTEDVTSLVSELEHAGRDAVGHVTWITSIPIRDRSTLTENALLVVEGPQLRSMPDDFRRFFINTIQREMFSSSVIGDYVSDVYECRIAGNKRNNGYCDSITRTELMDGFQQELFVSESYVAALKFGWAFNEAKLETVTSCSKEANVCDGASGQFIDHVTRLVAAVSDEDVLTWMGEEFLLDKDVLRVDVSMRGEAKLVTLFCFLFYKKNFQE